MRPSFRISLRRGWGGCSASHAPQSSRLPRQALAEAAAPSRPAPVRARRRPISGSLSHPCFFLSLFKKEKNQ